MFSPPLDPAVQTDQRAQDAPLYRGTLHGLIDMAANLARLIERGATPETAPALALPFERIARTIRQTIMLAHKLDEPVQAPVAPRRIAARQRIIRQVEDVLQRDYNAHQDVERLHAELLERMEGPDLEEAIDTRPVEDIITEICHDLCIEVMPGTNPWKRRTPADIAILCARAAQPHAVDPAPGPSPNWAAPVPRKPNLWDP